MVQIILTRNCEFTEEQLNCFFCQQAIDRDHEIKALRDSHYWTRLYNKFITEVEDDIISAIRWQKFNCKMAVKEISPYMIDFTDQDKFIEASKKLSDETPFGTILRLWFKEPRLDIPIDVNLVKVNLTARTKSWSYGLYYLEKDHNYLVGINFVSQYKL